jgi:hypothetical protein
MVERGATALLRWSWWRRWHQAWARFHHYRRRSVGDIPPQAGHVAGQDARAGRVPCEVDDSCWVSLDPLVPYPKPGGTPKGYTRRQFAAAYAYVRAHDCAWRALPCTFPPWHTVYERVRQWRRAGVLDQIDAVLFAGPS